MVSEDFGSKGSGYKRSSSCPAVPVSQFLSAVLVAIGVIYLIVMRKRNKPNALYEGRYCKTEKTEPEEA